MARHTLALVLVASVRSHRSLKHLLRALSVAARAMNRHDGVVYEHVANQRLARRSDGQGVQLDTARRERRAAARARLTPARERSARTEL